MTGRELHALVCEAIKQLEGIPPEEHWECLDAMERLIFNRLARLIDARSAKMKHRRSYHA